jgi:cobalamin biosynthesis protein CobD/CbiB
MLLQRIPLYATLAIAMLMFIAAAASGAEHEDRLHAAAKNGDVVTIRLLLDQAISVDTRDTTGDAIADRYPFNDFLQAGQITRQLPRSNLTGTSFP